MKKLSFCGIEMETGKTDFLPCDNRVCAIIAFVYMRQYSAGSNLASRTFDIITQCRVNAQFLFHFIERHQNVIQVAVSLEVIDFFQAPDWPILL